MEYDVKIEQNVATSIGLQRERVIKTTKIFTGAKSKLGVKIAELPSDKK